MRHCRRYSCSVFLVLLALLASGNGSAAPGDVLFNESFERSNLAPWTTTNGSRSQIRSDPDFSNTGTRGLFTRRNVVTTTSPTFSTLVPAAELTLWVRRGSDAFSEYPDSGEDLVLEYRRADASWGALRVYPGGGPAGEQFNDSFMLPPDGLHANFAVRVRQTGGSGTDFDYYHVDDIRIVERSPAPPLSVGTCDDFSAGLAGNWSVVSAGGNAGTSAATFQSPSRSLFTNGEAVSVISNPIDTTVPEFDAVSLWIRRGADAFSENPDGVEDLVIEYLNDASVWVLLERFSGGGSPGQTFLRSYAIPASGRHAGFQLRIRQTDGSGPSFDFWHVDDVCLDTRSLPSLRITKTNTTTSDPINGTVDPLAIPGAFANYTIVVENLGAGAVDSDTLTITDIFDGRTALYVDTAGGDPIQFTDGAISSGVSFSYATSVSFTEQSGGAPPFNYTPTPDADGFDASITGIQIQLEGAMAGDTGSGSPSFTLSMQVRVE
ncbi:MAG: hypothetical protein AAF270_15345 [Pseudomonadota bacterium]